MRKSEIEINWNSYFPLRFDRLRRNLHWTWLWNLRNLTNSLQTHAFSRILWRSLWFSKSWPEASSRKITSFFLGCWRMHDLVMIPKDFWDSKVKSNANFDGADRILMGNASSNWFLFHFSVFLVLAPSILGERASERPTGYQGSKIFKIFNKKMNFQNVKKK